MRGVGKAAIIRAFGVGFEGPMQAQRETGRQLEPDTHMKLGLPENMLRQARRADIPDLHRVRMSVLENRLNSTVMTEADYPPAIEDHGRGWLIEEKGEVVGFAVGNRNGNIWALFVHPNPRSWKGVGAIEQHAGHFRMGVRRTSPGSAPLKCWWLRERKSVR